MTDQHDIDNAKEKLTKAAALIDQHVKDIAGLKDQIDHLNALGVTTAKPHWRQRKYLYLVHPTQGDGTRRRQYIGNDPEKTRLALDTVERQKQLDLHVSTLRNAESQLRRLLLRIQDLDTPRHYGREW